MHEFEDKYLQDCNLHQKLLCKTNDSAKCKCFPNCTVQSVKRLSITAISTSTSYIRKLPKHTRSKHVGGKSEGLRLQNSAVVLFKSRSGGAG